MKSIAQSLCKRDGAVCYAYSGPSNPLWQPFQDLILAELGITVTAEQAGNAVLLAAAGALASKLAVEVGKSIVQGGPDISFIWKIPADIIAKAAKQASDAQASVTMTTSKSCPTGVGKVCKCRMSWYGRLANRYKANLSV